MKSIQEIFSQIKESAKEQKDIRKEYKDALVQSDGYEDVLEKLDELKKQKKEIEERVQSQLGSRWDKLDELKNKVAELKQMQNDVAMTTLMSGKPVEVKDEFDNLYEPVFSVSFKKTNAKNIPGL
jgi:chromosome segregation ATPase